MGRIWLPGGGGGGASSDDCTLMRAAVPAGMKAVTADSDDEAMEGTLNPDTTLADSQALSGQTFLKWNPQTKLFERHTGSMANRGTVNYSLPINGSYTIPAGYHNGSGKVTQNVPTKGAQTYTPGTTNQTIAANQYLTGPQTIKGDPNLISANIVKGKTIFGVPGVAEEYKTPASMPSYEGTITYHNGTATLSNGQNYLEITQNAFNGAKSIARFNTAVNLSGWNYINTTVKSSRAYKVYIGISKNTNLQNFAFDAQWVGTNPNTAGDVKLNVSSFSGTYYLYIGMETITDAGRTGFAEAVNITFSTQ